MGFPPVLGDNPRALASGLSYVQVDKHGITIYTTYISVDIAHHEIFNAKVGKGGIKHCITYLALTQLFPVLLARMPHIVKYTYNVLFAAFHLGVCRFGFSHGRVQMGQMDFISSNFY